MDIRRDDSGFRPGPVVVSRASMAWDDAAPRGSVSPPGPGASVQAEIATERARRRRLHVGHLPIAVAVASGLVFGVVGWGVVGGDLSPIAGVVFICATALLVMVGRRVTGGAVVRQLRRQARDEVRVARSLAPLQSAGWTVLQDRLVAAHRVPHILVGPPGVVLVYDHAVLGPWTRRVGRVLGVVRGVLRLLLAAPLAMRPGRGRRRAPAANARPDRDVIDTATWASTELAALLRYRPDLDGWTVTASPLFVVLRRPADRPLDHRSGVAFTDLGTRTRVYLQCGLPAGLSRPSVQFLASVVDDVCRPA